MKHLKFSICLETQKNNDFVEKLYDEVFGENRKDRTVYKFRTGEKVKDLCFVIKNTDTDIFACIRYWFIKIGLVNGLLLGPLAVRNNMRGYGLGSMLIKHSTKVANEKKFNFCFVSGEANLYPRFGFKKINDKDLILPGYIDPNRLYILYFKKLIEKEMGKPPWIVKSSIK